MNAKKWTALITGLCALVFMLALVGCGEQTPSKVTAAGLDAVKNQNIDALAKYSDTASQLTKNQESLSANGAIAALGEKGAEVTKKLLAKMYDFDYTLGQEKIDGTKATVAAEIKTYDVGKALTNAYKEYMSEAASALSSGKSSTDLAQAYADKVVKNLDALTTKDVTCNTTINLTQSNGQWKLNNLLTDLFTPLYQASMATLTNSAKELAANVTDAANAASNAVSDAVANASNALDNLQDSISNLTK